MNVTNALAAYGGADPNLIAQANQAATQYNIPTNIFQALVTQESAWNPTAQSPNSTSYGLTQMVAGTAAQMGANVYDTQSNLNGGAKYLSQMYSKFGNWSDALAAYNQGPGNYSNAGGAAYAQQVLAIANALPSGNALAAGSSGTSSTGDATAPASGAGASTNSGGGSSLAFGIGSFLDWIKARFGDMFFLLLGVVVVAIALLMTDTGQQVAKTTVKAVAAA